MSVPRPPGFCKRNLDTENGAKVWKNGKTVAIHLKKNNGNLHPEPSPLPGLPVPLFLQRQIHTCHLPPSVLLRYCFGIGSVIFRRYGTKGEGSSMYFSFCLNTKRKDTKRKKSSAESSGLLRFDTAWLSGIDRRT